MTVLITQSYNSKTQQAVPRRGNKCDAQYSFFNYIIKLQAVLPGRAQKALRSLNASARETAEGSAGQNPSQTVNWREKRARSGEGECEGCASFSLLISGLNLNHFLFVIFCPYTSLSPVSVM